VLLIPAGITLYASPIGQGEGKPAQLSTVTGWLKPEFSITNAVHVEERYEAWVIGSEGTTNEGQNRNT
jgi:hypothetical protein